MAEKMMSSDEKKAGSVVEEENVSIEEQKPQGLDQAAAFLEMHKDMDTSHIDISKLRHRVDRNVVSLLCLCFIMQLLDKAIYNYTALMGLPQDLHFKGNDFSNVASGYAFAHLAMQLPNAYLIQRLPAGKWLSSCVFAWGIVTLCTAFVQNYAGMMVARIFLAITEATITPSLMLITSQWFTKSEQAPRFAFWHSAAGIGQILGGLLSYAFQGVPANYPMHGWRLMYLALGGVTFLVGAISLYWLPDSPMNAKFLKDEEKVAILRHVSVNMTGVANHKARPAEMLEAAKDPQIYLLIFPGIFGAMSAGLTGTYSTTLIKKMGFTPRHSALLNMPSGLVGITANMIVGFGVRHTSNRWAWAVGTTFPGIIGASLLTFVGNRHRAASLMGIYLVSAIYSITTVTQQWAMANVSGTTKRACMAAAMSACYGIGGIIAPQTFQHKDEKTGYRPAKITILCTQAACCACFLSLWQYYKFENRRRDKIHKAVTLEDDLSGQGADVTTEESWSGLTDKQNKRFRYVY